MVDPVSRMNPEVLAGALRDVVGEDAEQAMREGPKSVARLVRQLLADPLLARRLVDAATARETECRAEDDLPLTYGPVATDSGIYDDPELMLDPMGSPEFDAAMDSLAHGRKGKLGGAG